MGKIKELIKNPAKILTYPFIRLKLGSLMPDKIYLKIAYLHFLGKRLNLKNPQTFNEKLQWLKLYNRNPLYTIMVDKIKAKEWAAERIGSEYIIPTIAIWEKASDINFDSLPNKFVMKTNHDSGRVIICNDKSKLDISLVRKRMKASLKRNYYLYGREWPYKNVQRRIIVEELLENNTTTTDDIPDYKFMCFNGVVLYCFTCTERRSNTSLKVTFFDNEWNKLPFTRHYNASEHNIPKPHNFDKMKELAETLSKGIPFLRVDFYEVNNKMYFGEMTFFPGSGFEEFNPEKWDKFLGDCITLPDSKLI